MNTSRTRPSIPKLVGLGSALLASTAYAGDTLKVGDPAPALKVSEWLKGNPVHEFKKGKVYVIDFWATWNFNTRAAVPYLTGVAHKFKGKATIMGIGVWQDNPSFVGTFVKRMGSKMDYAVAVDYPRPSRNGFMSVKWLRATGEDALPVTYIVDKRGKIAWIGETSSLEPVLSKVVAGTWDAAAFAQRLKAERAAEKPRGNWESHRAVIAEFNKIRKLVRAKAFNEALKETDAVAKMKAPGAPEAPLDYATYTRVEIYAQMGDMTGFTKSANAAAERFKNEPSRLTDLVWIIADPASTLPKKNYDLALKWANRAVYITKRRDPLALDALAWTHFGKGDKSVAIAIEKEAIAVAPEDQKAQFKSTLNRLQS